MVVMLREAKDKKKKTAVALLFALWLILHMSKISTTAWSYRNTDSHLVKY